MSVWNWFFQEIWYHGTLGILITIAMKHKDRAFDIFSVVRPLTAKCSRHVTQNGFAVTVGLPRLDHRRDPKRICCKLIERHRPFILFLLQPQYTKITFGHCGCRASHEVPWAATNAT